jgi:hypothetical protein
MAFIACNCLFKCTGLLKKEGFFAAGYFQTIKSFYLVPFGKSDPVARSRAIQNAALMK